MDSCSTESKSPSLPSGWALLPLQLEQSHSASCPFTVVSLVASSMLPPPSCCSFYCLPRFSISSSFTHLRPLLRCHTNSEAFLDYSTLRSNPHSPPTSASPTLPSPLCWFILLLTNLLPTDLLLYISMFLLHISEKNHVHCLRAGGLPFTGVLP